jgi:hypothetical protein
VVEPTPLKNMSSSLGMMTFPIYAKIINVPNHQPDIGILRWEDIRLLIPGIFEEIDLQQNEMGLSRHEGYPRNAISIMISQGILGYFGLLKYFAIFLACTIVQSVLAADVFTYCYPESLYKL